jgi:hypothetical protein
MPSAKTSSGPLRNSVRARHAHGNESEIAARRHAGPRLAAAGLSGRTDLGDSSERLRALIAAY